MNEKRFEVNFGGTRIGKTHEINKLVKKWESEGENVVLAKLGNQDDLKGLGFTVRGLGVFDSA